VLLNGGGECSEKWIGGVLPLAGGVGVCVGWAKRSISGDRVMICLGDTAS